MTTCDRITLSCIIAPIIPILFFLSFWWTSLAFLHDNRVFLVALTGLLLGIIIDMFYLKKWVQTAFQIPLLLLLLIYVFYSICFFGFFMGVPIFNLFLGIPVGYFIARQTNILKLPKNKAKKRVEKTSLATAMVMLLICISSATIALNDPYTAGNIQGMFQLPFHVSQQIIVWIIIVGGATLVLLQYAVTKWVAYMVNNIFLKYKKSPLS